MTGKGTMSKLRPETTGRAWPTLSRAPIVEGLIDVRVTRTPGLTMDALMSFADDMADEFPSRGERRRWMGQVELSPTKNATISTTTDEPDGVVLRSADEKWVAQFQLEGFTLSRLAPYTSWDELRSRAAALWTRYSELNKSAQIVRVATRFINAVQLPKDRPLEETFLTSFTMPDTLPRSVAGYLLRVVVPFEDIEAITIITISLDPNSEHCLFDIDAFADRPQGLPEAEMWKQLEALRHAKNRVFFGSLTPTALESFR
jgi:uncharacterized protein (TIGR04255 family)